MRHLIAITLLVAACDGDHTELRASTDPACAAESQCHDTCETSIALVDASAWRDLFQCHEDCSPARPDPGSIPWHYETDRESYSIVDRSERRGAEQCGSICYTFDCTAVESQQTPLCWHHLISVPPEAEIVWCW